jgi:hypothetical protein
MTRLPDWLVAYHHPILRGDDPLGMGSDVDIVGHRDHRNSPLLVQPLENGHDLLAGFAVQVPGGLIREQQGRVFHQGPGNAHPLLLAAGELGGAMPYPIAKPYSFQSFQGAPPPVPPVPIEQRKLHNTEGWQEVLEPAVQGHQKKRLRLLFRAEAAFAKPEVYEYLEQERIGYAIRLPANEVLQRQIQPLLERPNEWPSREPIFSYHDFTYQAQSWHLPRRVMAKSLP